MKAYLTIGMPASGKTTWAQQQINLVNINLDDCRAEVSGQAENQDATLAAVVLHEQKIKQSASQGLDIIISDTNLNSKFRDELVSKLVSLGYAVEYILFPISLEVAKSRNQQRSRVVPDEILERMFTTFQATQLPGKLLIGNTLVSSEITKQLNQLVNLEVLFPTQDLISLSFELLDLDLITLDGNKWKPGNNLPSWLEERGLLDINLCQYLSPKIEDLLSLELPLWPNELSTEAVFSLISKVFVAPLSEEKHLRICGVLLQHSSILKTCFTEQGKLISPSKLAEIIKELLIE
jgi:predicted kinase